VVETTRLLSMRLEASEPKKLAPGNVLEDRRYEETLYVF
jgi:hypothetical protein